MPNKSDLQSQYLGYGGRVIRKVQFDAGLLYPRSRLIRKQREINAKAMARTQYFISDSDNSILLIFAKIDHPDLKLKGKTLFSTNGTELCVKDNGVEHLFLC